MARVRVLPESARSPGRRETENALSLAQRMPRLVLEARRVAANLAHGIHGRRLLVRRREQVRIAVERQPYSTVPEDVRDDLRMNPLH